MPFTLKKQKYGWRHIFLIPFQCEAIGSIGFSIQKLMTASAAVFQIPCAANFIDRALKYVNNGGGMTEVVKWLVLLMICVGWQRISYEVGQFFRNRAAIYTEKNILRELTDKRARLSYTHIEDPKTWDLINRVCKDVRETVTFGFQRFLNFVLYMIRISGVIIIISTQVWWISLIVLALCIPLIIMSAKSGSKNYEAYKLAAEHERMHKYLSEVLSGRETVNERSLFKYTDIINDIWYKKYNLSRKISLRADRKKSIWMFTGSTITTLFSGVVMLVMIQPTLDGQISIGMFMALALGVYHLVHMVGVQMVQAISNLTRVRAYYRDLTLFANLSEIDGVLDVPDYNQNTVKKIEFKNVSFKYPKTDIYILKNLDFLMNQGAHYAFVGANGAGKTTITKLLTGLYDDFEGEILINNRNIKDYTRGQLKGFFAAIYQDFARYFVTVRDNILLGDVANIENNSRDKEMIEITQSLGIHHELMELSRQYNTPLGKLEQNGVDLSGGQWQKIAMARATISRASVQILDEPTAALDPISESQVYEQFHEISKNKTTLFISHRLGSTKLAKKIFVLAEGTIAEQGTHEELMAYKGIYAQMYESQRSWYQ